MGMFSDAGDQVVQAATKADITTARKLEAAFADIKMMEERLATAKRTLGTRVASEFPGDPGISEMVLRQATTQAKFVNDATEVMGVLRKAHQHEWERIESPRTNEQAWDVVNNQE